MQEKIILMVDEKPFKVKPQGAEIGEIQNYFKKEVALKKLTIDEFLKKVSNGHTYYPASPKVFGNGTKNENWKEQQLIAIDVDSDDEKIITIEETLKKLEEVKLNPFAYYESFSNTKERPKFRVLFLLDNPTNNAEKMQTAIKILLDIISGDPACKNLGRIYFGTNGEKQEVKLLDYEARVSLDEILKLKKEEVKNNSNPKNNKNGNSLSDLINGFDLLSYIVKESPIYRTSGNITYFKKCTICGHEDCLCYFHDSNKFKCFGKNGDVGGSIIDYLIATRKMKQKEAIKYFKQELLGMNEEEIASYCHLDVIKSQADKVGIDTSIITSCYWITDDEVSCSLLADFIRNNMHYMFVRNEATEGILRYFYIDGYYKLVSDDEINGIINSLVPMKLQSSKTFSEVRRLLYSDLKYVKMSDKNNNENIINFNNGILHLDTMELGPHSPEYRSTIRIPCDYVEKVSKPETRYFDKYLDDLTEGDEELKRLFMQLIGLTISNIRGYRMKKALFMQGKGNSGKSVIKIFLKALLGEENTSEIDLKQLEDKFGKSQLLDKRLVGSNDMGYITIPALTVFKQATGGDSIYMEKKFKNGFSCTFNGFLWFCCNELPKFGGDKEEWVYDRILVIECNNVIPKENQDKNLVEHLLTEKDYIVSESIKALKQVIEKNYQFDIPQKCLEANKKYQRDNNSFLRFLEECTTKRLPGVSIKDNCTKGKIYEVYKAWCKDNNKGFVEQKSDVRRLLEKMDMNTTIKTNGGQEYYIGFTLTDDAKMEYSTVYGVFDGVAKDDEALEVSEEVKFDDGFDF